MSEYIGVDPKTGKVLTNETVEWPTLPVQRGAVIGGRVYRDMKAVHNLQAGQLCVVGRDVVKPTLWDKGRWAIVRVFRR